MPLAPQMMLPTTILVAVLGLVMGSFLNCLAWRSTHGESVLEGRSHCTSCGHVLGPADLVPVLSWVFSGGKCRYCGERVSWRYPATEVLCSVIYVSIFLRYGLTLETVELIAFASVLLVLSLTDLDSYIIPNATIVAAIVIRVVYLVVNPLVTGTDLVGPLVESLIGFFGVGIAMLVVTLAMDFLLGKESLGGGDIKLLAVAGLYFGWQQCLFLIVVACVLWLVFAALASRGRETLADGTMSSDHLIPFGPAIAAACWVTMLWGRDVLAWYLGLFGLG